MNEHTEGPKFPVQPEQEGGGPQKTFREAMQELASLMGIANITDEMLMESLMLKIKEKQEFSLRTLNEDTLRISDIAYENSKATLWLHHQGAQQSVQWKATCELQRLKQPVGGVMVEVAVPSWKVISKSKLDAAIRKSRRTY